MRNHSESDVESFDSRPEQADSNRYAEFIHLFAILNTRGFERGQHHLQFNRYGTLRGGVSGGFATSCSNAIRPGKWYNIVGVVDRRTGVAHFFVDGDKVTSVAWSLDIPLYFGPGVPGGFTRLSGEDGGRDFRGRMDELVLFDRALTEAEVVDLFEAGNGF